MTVRLLDLTAAQLVADRICSATCLLAGAWSDDCGCPCKGRWHGALGGMRVPDSGPIRRPLPAPQDGPTLFDELAATTAGEDT